MNPFEQARTFDQHLEREHQEFPLARVQQLVKMQPGLLRLLAALRVLPALIRMAARTLKSRWHCARVAPESGAILTVHALEPGGGFIRGWYSDGRWWTRDFVDDGTTWGSSKEREIRVTEYRAQEGSRAEPWHEQERYWPPDFEDRPPRKDPAPTPYSEPEWAQTHTQKRYVRALRCWAQWDPAAPPSPSEVESWVRDYLRGMDYELVSAVNGFRVFLNGLPLVRQYSCGQDPETVVPKRPMVSVGIGAGQCVAMSVDSTLCEAIALGLTVWIGDALKLREREKASARSAQEDRLA